MTVSAPLPASSRDETTRAIFYAVAAVFVFAAVNALTKWEVARYPITEVVLFRSIFALVPCAGLVAASGGLPVLRTRRLAEHFMRALVQFICVASIFVAFRMMPLADAVAITFTSPLFMTLLSIPLLGEQVGRHRWTAMLAGFAGVLIMAPPGLGLLSGGAFFALVNAASNAYVTIAVRRMSGTEASTTLVAYQLGFNALFALVLLPLGWTAPTLADAALMALIGLGAGVGQYWWTQAFRYAPTAVAAPFSYTAMIWALLFGFLIWGDMPTSALLTGAASIAASGLYILYRETIRRRRPAAAAAGAATLGTPQAAGR
ncbi:MAG TPA: DMT family transporter [Stellaceae bacterium]